MLDKSENLDHSKRFGVCKFVSDLKIYEAKTINITA